MKALLALLALASPVFAGTIVHNVTVPLDNVATTTMSIPAFDPANGTLTDVYVSGFVDMQFTYFAENTWSEHEGWIGFGGVCSNTTSNWERMRITLPSSGKKLVDETYVINDMEFTLGGFDGIIDFGGSSGFTQTWYTTVAMDPVTRIRNALYLSEFYGTGNVTCNVARTFHGVFCPEFPGYAGLVFENAGYFTVTYVYQ